MADITSIPLEHTATRNSGINAGTAETAKEQIKCTTGNSQRAMRAQTNKRLGTTSKKLGTTKGILGTANGQLGTANGKLGTTNGKLGSTASSKLRTANGKLGSANWVQATTNTCLVNIPPHIIHGELPIFNSFLRLWGIEPTGGDRRIVALSQNLYCLLLSSSFPEFEPRRTEALA
ncbi:hypothetical protein B0H13DRAFT_1919806 [Mycena leptocephala]|nr:hypothetical protein B0H13DRAFT_1919806 [Mycena leptocephala]